MNLGNYTHTQLLEEMNTLFAKRGAQTSAVTIAIVVIGIIGNVFVLLAYWNLYKRKTKQLKGRYFMPHLALADLIACAVGSFVFLFFDFHRLTFFSDVGCRLSTFSAWSTNAVSVLMLLVISVNRYLKICCPHHQQMTLFWKRAALLIITVVSIISCLPFLHLSGVRQGWLNTTEFADVMDLPPHLQNKSIHYNQCATAKDNNMLWKLFYNFLFIVQLGNMVAMIFLYVPMGKIIYQKYRENRESRPVEYKAGVSDSKGTTFTSENTSQDESAVPSTDIAESSDVQSRNVTNQIRARKPRGRKQKAWTNARNRFTVMFLVVVIVYAITNLPTFIFLYAYMESRRFRRYFIGDSDFEVYNLVLSLPRIHLINNIVNPFIYGYFDLTFRREVKAICNSIIMKPKKICCSCKKVEF
ncbi:tachykinin-like peptides receptor 99D [Saccostrea cucullata]|uniref:tachykinin-like peptides receptor 99D n=1 Tax=Saccostrea cuccullata TaxID=36930 RepID=UPI002ED0AE5D